MDSKHLLDCDQIQQEYLLFALAPEQHEDRIHALANLWLMGVEHQFGLLVEQPTQDYLDDYGTDEERWFLYPTEQGYDRGLCRSWDLRRFDHMRHLRQCLLENR